VVKNGPSVVEYESDYSQSDCSKRKRYAGKDVNAMTQRQTASSDRRAALGWIAGQLAWENRLQTLRTDDPDPETADAEATEIDSAA
jgi:hypothetical protein